MKKEKKKKNFRPDKDPAIINEPSASMNLGSIVFFKSLQDENEYTWRQYASMTPEERLAIVTQLRLKVFPYFNTNLNPWGNKLYFD